MSLQNINFMVDNSFFVNDDNTSTPTIGLVSKTYYKMCLFFMLQLQTNICINL